MSENGFLQFELDSAIMQAIADMGYQQPTAIQEQVIPHILDGHNVLGCAHTGTGKTAAFVLPLLQLLLDDRSEQQRSQALILTPTRELANQVLKVVKQASAHVNFSSAVLTGGVDFEAQKTILETWQDLIVATPGRLLQHVQEGNYSLEYCTMLVLDEADRMLDMGFADNCLRIINQANALCQTHLFSATLEGKHIRSFARQVLEEPVSINLAQERVDLSNFDQRVFLADSRQHKNKLLTALLQDSRLQQVFVFVSTKDRAQQVYSHLVNEGVKVAPLHGDMKQHFRKLTIKNLLKGELRVVVATDVAARGIDIQGLTHVINYDLPRGAEVYVHRIGRSGRAEAQGIVYSLVEAHDARMLRRIENYIDAQLPRCVVEGLEPQHREPVFTRKKVKDKAKLKKLKKAKDKKQRKLNVKRKVTARPKRAASEGDQ